MIYLIFIYCSVCFIEVNKTSLFGIALVSLSNPVAHIPKWSEQRGSFPQVHNTGKLNRWDHNYNGCIDLVEELTFILIMSWHIFLNNWYVPVDVFTTASFCKLYCNGEPCLFPWYYQALSISLETGYCLFHAIFSLHWRSHPSVTTSSSMLIYVIILYIF